MTPAQLAKSGSEAAHQTAFFAWIAVARRFGVEAASLWASSGKMPTGGSVLADALPELRWIHHVPNGGSRGDTAQSRSIEGGKLKAQGVRPGVLDIFWPFKSSGYSGLYIEMKAPSRKGTKNCGLSQDQIDFGFFATEQNFKCVVCYSWEEAVKEVIDYRRL